MLRALQRKGVVCYAWQHAVHFLAWVGYVAEHHSPDWHVPGLAKRPGAQPSTAKGISSSEPLSEMRLEVEIRGVYGDVLFKAVCLSGWKQFSQPGKGAQTQGRAPFLCAPFLPAMKR